MPEVSIGVSVSEFGETLVSEGHLLDEGMVVLRIESGEQTVGVSMNASMAVQVASRLMEAAKQALPLEKARKARREAGND